MRRGTPLLKRGVAAALAVVLLAAGCGPDESDLPPDGRLQRELGLQPTDRVHEVVLHGGMPGSIDPVEAVVAPGDYLQFVTADSWIHEITFDADSLDAPAVTFMEGLDQMASPPLVSRGSRFVVSFVDAPPGRYPYVVLGNGAPKRGAVVVEDPEAP